MRNLLNKNNNPYGIFVLEDYSGTREFRLFGEEYINYRNYLITGSLLYFDGSMLHQKWNNRLSLRINKVIPISDVTSKLIKEIKFIIPLEDIKTDSINIIKSILEKYPGEHRFSISVISENVTLDFLSKKYTIKICKTFINEMKKSISNNFILKFNN